jgi:hypothetical protein
MQDLTFSQRWLWRVLSSGIKRCVVRWKSTDVSGGTWRLCLLLSSRCFLAWFLLRPWWWRRHVPPERRLTLDGLHGIISLKWELFLVHHVFTLLCLNLICSHNSSCKETIISYQKHLEFQHYDLCTSVIRRWLLERPLNDMKELCISCEKKNAQIWRPWNLKFMLNTAIMWGKVNLHDASGNPSIPIIRRLSLYRKISPVV